MQRLRPPRLLPITIAVLAVALVSKAGLLVHSALDRGEPAAVITAAHAAATEAPAAAEHPATKTGTAAPAQPSPKPPNVAEAPPPVPEGPPPMTEGEKAVLLDLRARREQLDTREAALASRESMLVAAEKQLSARVAELQGLQQKLEALDTTHKQQENTAWQGLVKVYEDMKPRDAAAIFNDLAMPVLISVVDRMKEAKAAAILAAMVPEKAREVTTQLALKRTRPATAIDPGDKPTPNRGAGKALGSGT